MVPSDRTKDNRHKYLGFFKYINNKRKIKDNVSPLLNEVETLVMVDTEEAKFLNTFLGFVFSDKTRRQGSQTQESKEKECWNENLSLVMKNWKDLDSLDTRAENCLKFKKGKCRVLHLGKNKPRHQYRLGADLVMISSVQKDLGVLLDKNLSMSEQCSIVVEKTNSILECLRKSTASNLREKSNYLSGNEATKSAIDVRIAQAGLAFDNSLCCWTQNHSPNQLAEVQIPEDVDSLHELNVEGCCPGDINKHIFSIGISEFIYMTISVQIKCDVNVQTIPAYCIWLHIKEDDLQEDDLDSF
ncbi:hypothetical protein WISP_116659 [Willisornis vidua]|uniref:Rna-directed dna polymerase from mobile element jockey-like n=1 Tax=Willisornis vidua TaxID=1566151 RepID=A0ABQ9CYF3_9PASS|nr:hypothetical protein WISP_116659 [Willisornis vidua]